MTSWHLEVFGVLVRRAAQELIKILNCIVIAAGGFKPDTAETAVSNGDADLITFGLYFISNPDLPKKSKNILPLSRRYILYVRSEGIRRLSRVR